MAFVLTSASSLTCGHQVPPKLGKVIVTGIAKLRVRGAPALRASDLASATIGDCGTVIVTSEILCTKVESVTAGAATKLRAGGEPVLLDTLKGVTNGVVGATPQAFLAGTAGHTKLQAT
jgi:hypothetical protein